jgi:nucleoside-diphosphate-sugar epimerase
MTASLAIVTGAPGWVGSRLVEALQGEVADARVDEAIASRVRCLVGPQSSVTATTLRGCELVNGDLTDPLSLGPLLRDAGGATLFHCAGVIHPMHGVREFYDVNMRGTEYLIARAEAAGVRRFVYLSSNSVVGVSRDPADVFDERTPEHPYMNYGRSKKAAEDLVNAAAARGRIETTIVRAPWFYGPHQPPRQTEFFTMIRTGRVPLVGNGSNRRSMAYVDNLCQGLMLAATKPAALNGMFWIADRRPYTMNEIIATIADVMEQDFGVAVKRGVIRVPAFTSDLAYLADRALQAIGLYHSKIHVLSEMSRTIACSTARAEQELGYRPAIELREGMRRSLAWMKEAGIAF